MITGIKPYDTLEEYLKENLENAVPGINNINEAIKIYCQWNTLAEINEVGFLAIKVKVMGDQRCLIKKSVDNIYNQCIKDLKGKKVTTANYTDASGITTCFTFNHLGFFQDKRNQCGGLSDDEESILAMGNKPYEDLKNITDNINRRISTIFTQSGYNPSTYLARQEDVHITAASVINPSQNIITDNNWNSSVNNVKEIIEESKQLKTY
jgi:hypothetical protein